MNVYMLVAIGSLLLVPIAQRMHKLVLWNDALITRIAQIQTLIGCDTSNVRGTE